MNDVFGKGMVLPPGKPRFFLNFQFSAPKPTGSSAIILLVFVIYAEFVLGAVSPATSTEEALSIEKIPTFSAAIDSGEKSIASPSSCCQDPFESEATAASITEVATPSASSAGVSLGIEEKLGAVLPLDLFFTDETGVTKTLRERLNKPSMLAFVFYRCPLMCNLIQGNVADVIKKIKMKPGEEYNVISVSIDELDNADTAREKKAEFFNTLDSKFPDSAWKFLYGTKENIQILTKAAGFYFDRINGTIVHPAALIFVSPKGKIVRYLHGTQYLPLNVTLALTEAAEGRAGFAVKSVVSFCFSFDPAGKRYVLNIMRISGLIIVLFVGIFLFFLLKSGNAPRRK